MRVHVIDVGEADSILLEFPRHAVMIDAGGENTGDSAHRSHLLDYLHQFFKQRTDLNNTLQSLIITHPHIDHTVYALDILKNFKVRNLIDGGDRTGSGIAPLIAARQFGREHKVVYNRVLDTMISSLGYSTSMLDEIGEPEVNIRFLSGSRGCANENNNSLVILVTYHKARFLFTGDAGSDDKPECSGEINLLLKRYEGTDLLDADVLKTSRHGSLNGTSAAFLQAISPRISLISAGKNETRSPGVFHAWQFGHPREQAIQLIEQFTADKRFPVLVKTMLRPRVTSDNRQLNKAIYCTCWDGDIIVSVSKEGTEFSVQVSN
jgi:competence protein ComEC